jgi:hypothetical protein
MGYVRTISALARPDITANDVRGRRVARIRATIEVSAFEERRAYVNRDIQARHAKQYR